MTRFDAPQNDHEAYVALQDEQDIRNFSQERAERYADWLTQSIDYGLARVERALEEDSHDRDVAA